MKGGASRRPYARPNDERGRFCQAAGAWRRLQQALAECLGLLMSPLKIVELLVERRNVARDLPAKVWSRSNRASRRGCRLGIDPQRARHDQPDPDQAPLIMDIPVA